jgi:putative endonuclease
MKTENSLRRGEVRVAFDFQRPPVSGPRWGRQPSPLERRASATRKRLRLGKPALAFSWLVSQPPCEGCPAEARHREDHERRRTITIHLRWSVVPARHGRLRLGKPAPAFSWLVSQPLCEGCPAEARQATCPAEARRRKAQREGGLSTEHLNTCVTLQELPRLHFFSEHTHGIPRIRSGAAIARRTCVSYSKRFVYILRSAADPTRYYVGLTSDVARRLDTHNSGGSLHTVDHRPWELVAAVEFSNENSAILFERYLKTGSGRAFAKRHFV